jgi:predicted subunit of tRNA(5-methylaminomethyl-2-thiouridylate) methyltransferase
MNSDGTKIDQIKTKRTNISHLKSLKTKKKITYCIGNPKQGFGHVAR